MLAAAVKVTKVPIIEFMTAGGEIPQTRLFQGRPGAYWVRDGLGVKFLKVYLPDGRVGVPDGAGALKVTNPDGTIGRMALEELPE
jgi:hypothetical protein